MTTAIRNLTAVSRQTLEERLNRLLADVQLPRTYTVPEVAQFFGKSNNWVYWILDNRSHLDGAPFEPQREGRSLRFPRTLVEQIGVTNVANGSLTRDGLLEVLRRLDKAEEC